MTSDGRYGFWSDEAHEGGFGTSFYLTPEGREIEVTVVTPDREGQEYLWPDKRFVGEVARLLRVGQPNVVCRSRVTPLRRSGS